MRTIRRGWADTAHTTEDHQRNEEGRSFDNIIEDRNIRPTEQAGPIFLS